MFNFVRRKVSLKKRRFQEDGYDLDLTYINPTVVAMGFPAVGVESLYRNPRNQVYKNIKTITKCITCALSLIGVTNPKCFTQEMGAFCDDVEKWLNEDEKNLAAIHCKAGKGRAGMMICCWLIHSQIAPTADEAMLKYGHLRTSDGKRRFVRYYEDIYYYGLPKARTIKLESLTIKTSAYAKKGSAYPSLVILNRAKKELFRSAPQKVKSGDFTVDFDGLKLKGDVQVLIYDRSIKVCRERSTYLKKDKEACAFWFSTCFIDNNELVLKKPEIDKAFKDKKCKRFKPDFGISLTFEGSEESAMTKLKQKGRIREKKETGKKKRSNKSKKKSKSPKQNGKSESKKEEKPVKKEAKKVPVKEKEESDSDSDSFEEVAKKEEKKEVKKEEKTEEKEVPAKKVSDSESDSDSDSDSDSSEVPQKEEKKEVLVKKQDSESDASDSDSSSSDEEDVQEKKEEAKEETPTKKEDSESSASSSSSVSSSSDSEDSSDSEEVIVMSNRDPTETSKTNGDSPNSSDSSSSEDESD